MNKLFKVDFDFMFWFRRIHQLALHNEHVPKSFRTRGKTTLNSSVTKHFSDTRDQVDTLQFFKVVYKQPTRYF